MFQYKQLIVTVEILQAEDERLLPFAGPVATLINPFGDHRIGLPPDVCVPILRSPQYRQERRPAGWLAKKKGASYH
jgi:hypothetical protein